MVVAHPDDECIAYGGILQRMREAHLMYLTDGSPHDEYFWKNHGSREAYSRMRQLEARAAAANIGINNVEFVADKVPSLVDQQLFRNLDVAHGVLRERVKDLRPDAIATLAYEGGHPDHDSCNLLCSIMSSETGIPVWEAPLYRRHPEDSKTGVYQDFVLRNGTEQWFEPTLEELDRKKKMCAAYPSQGDFISAFRLNPELMRPLARYDYTRPAHEGKLNYEMWQWSMTGEEVCEEFARFLNRLKRCSARSATDA